MAKKPKSTVEYRAVKNLKELERNPRQISKENFEILKTSIKNNPDYFEARPVILSNRTGELVVIAGNQRLKAAKALGIAEVPTVLLEGLTEEREKEIIIRDNVENGEWDFDALANEWSDLPLNDWGILNAPSADLDINDDDFLQDTEIAKNSAKKIKCPKKKDLYAIERNNIREWIKYQHYLDSKPW